MLLFRSEEHVDRWLAQRRLPKGAVFTPEKLWGLAHAWYKDRLRPDWWWMPKEQVRALFDSLGFVGEFWRRG